MLRDVTRCYAITFLNVFIMRAFLCLLLLIAATSALEPTLRDDAGGPALLFDGVYDILTTIKSSINGIYNKLAALSGMKTVWDECIRVLAKVLGYIPEPTEAPTESGPMPTPAFEPYFD